MYSIRSGLILGFHGCDRSVAQKVLNGENMLKSSANKYDWLGSGIYFWENSPARALEFAEHLRQNPQKSKGTITEPAVIGAVIHLGFCLDLLDYANLLLLKESYDTMLAYNKTSFLPQNKNVKGFEGLLLRELDCAVIETLHTLRAVYEQSPFDSVRGMFSEGKEIYPNAGFRDKDHIQICIRNPNCIKGFFLPRELDLSYPKI